MADKGSSTYMILDPGHQLVLAEGKTAKLAMPITQYAVEMTRGGRNAEIVVNPDGAVAESPNWGDAREE